MALLIKYFGIVAKIGLQVNICGNLTSILDFRNTNHIKRTISRE